MKENSSTNWIVPILAGAVVWIWIFIMIAIEAARTG
mgnify:CR=1 FL=1